MTLARVVIATTEGPSEIQSVSAEDPDVRSVVCLNGKAEALPISAAYDSFVRQPTGVIERDFGVSPFRVDVSDPISGGVSWQLGLYVAHILFHSDALATKDETCSELIWATGEVDRKLAVHAVTGISDKIKNSKNLFDQSFCDGVKVRVIVPQENLIEARELLDDQVELIGISSLNELSEYISPVSDQSVINSNPLSINFPQGSRQIVSMLSSRAFWLFVSILVFVPSLVIAVQTYRELTQLNQYRSDGKLRELSEEMEASKEGRCWSCYLAAHIFQARIYVRNSGKIRNVHRVDTRRVHQGKRCRQFGPSQESLAIANEVEQTGGVWSIKQDGSICFLVVTASAQSKNGEYLWSGIFYKEDETKAAGDPPAKLFSSAISSPGEEFQFETRVPYFPKNKMRYRIISVTHEGNIDAGSIKWLETQAHQFWNNLDEVREEFGSLGLSFHASEIVLSADQNLKPRFR